MKKNCLKQKIKAGETVIGTWCILPSPSVINVLGESGLDFIVIDMEHGPISFETAENMIRAAEICDCTPLIRVPKNDESDVLRALDIGAHGVVIPHIETVDDRQQAIAHIKYPPLGHRGLSMFTRAGKYDPEDATLHTARENIDTLSVLMVEGKTGIANLESIIQDDSLDVVFFGLCDISQSLGYPGQIDHPEVKKYVTECVAKARSFGVATGAFTSKAEMLPWFKQIGIQFITYSLDTTELCRSFKSVVRTFK